MPLKKIILEEKTYDPQEAQIPNHAIRDWLFFIGAVGLFITVLLSRCNAP